MKKRSVMSVVLCVILLFTFLPGNIVFASNPMTTRYTLSNGYYYISGVSGVIDTIEVDPTGAGNYSTNIIKTGHNLYMCFNMDFNIYTGSGSVGTWDITGNTLTLNDIQFGTTAIAGYWTISLNGDTMQNSFRLKNTQGPVKVYNAGFRLEVPFEKDGYDLTTNVFSKFITSRDFYIDARGLKRLTEDRSVEMRGDWIHAFGTNGYNFDLRFNPDTDILSPFNLMDYQEMRFFANDSNDKTKLNQGQEITRILDIKAYAKDVFTLPDSYPVFTSSNQSLADSVNAMYYERNFGWPGAATNADWNEWMMLSRSWINSPVRDIERANMLSEQMEPDGTLWAWYDKATWPFGYKHEITASANFISGSYRYFVATGDTDFLKLNIERMRSAMNHLLSMYSGTDKIFILDNSHNTGQTGAEGSNYYDVTPYGYKDAYSNIYGYHALRTMAEVESIVGNPVRAVELTNYANDLKTAYNNIFFNGDVYVQTIDNQGVTHNYDCTYLNFEAVTYGLADASRASSIIDYFTNKVTPSGTADVFSKWVIGPRLLTSLNPDKSQGGWWIGPYNPPADYNQQLQHGGTDFYVAFYEMMSRITGKGVDDAYARLNQIVDRFNLPDHLSGGNPLYNGEINQHNAEGAVGVWGEFPESSIVPTIALYGLMGVNMDKDGLHVTPNLPTGLDSFGVQKFNYWNMNLQVDITSTTVRIKALSNDSQYSWIINGTPASGLFDVTTTIAPGGTVTLQRSSNTTFDLSSINPNYVKEKIGEWTDILSADHTWEYVKKINDGLNVLSVFVNDPHNPNSVDSTGGVIGEFTLPDGSKINTDSSWKVSKEPDAGWTNPDFDDTGWDNASSYGSYGAAPWLDNVPGLGGTSGNWIWSDANKDGYMPIAISNVAASSTLWPATNVCDGNPGTCWSSTTIGGLDSDQWIMLDLGSHQDVRGIDLTPRQDGGWCFPVDFRIEKSNDGVNWDRIRGQSYTNYSNPGSAVQVFNFADVVNARYVRIYATKLGADSVGNKYFQLAEVAVNGMKYMPGRISEDDTLYNTGGNVTASSELTGMGANYACDGNYGTIWSSTSHSGESATEWLQFDLGSAKNVGRIIIQPRGDGGWCFPRDFKLQCSSDGTNWTDIEGQNYTDYPATGSEQQVFTLSGVINARYIRIYCTKLSVDPVGVYYCQIADVKIYARNTPEIYTSFASSELDSASWHSSRAIDDEKVTCWSSNYHNTENADEWIALDLKYKQRIGIMEVRPRYNTGLYFPVDFKFQYSNDKVNWIDVPGQSYTNYPNPGEPIQKFIFDTPVYCRYIRMYATKLGGDASGNYYFMVSDIDAKNLNSTYFRKTFYASTQPIPISGAAASSQYNSDLSPDKAVDGNNSTFWSSTPTDASTAVQWLYVDAGSIRTIKQIRLKPRSNGFGFPLDFKFQYSYDASSWYDIPGLSYKNYSNPGDLEQTFAIRNPVDARYIRLYATKVGMDNVGENLVQMDEIELDGDNAIIVDNDDTGFAYTGTVYYNSTVQEAEPMFGGDERLMPAGDGTSYCTFTPAITTTAYYKVYAYWTDGSNRADNAPFTIYYQGGNTTVRVNQKENGGQWVYLGTYDFASGTSGYVQVSNDANGYVMADALKFIPASP